MAQTTQVKLHGDKVAAQRVVDSQLKRLLGNFRNFNAFQGLKQNQARVVLSDGESFLGEIVFKTHFGIETVDVFMNPAAHRPEVFERPVDDVILAEGGAPLVPVPEPERREEIFTPPEVELPKRTLIVPRRRVLYAFELESDSGIVICLGGNFEGPYVYLPKTIGGSIHDAIPEVEKGGVIAANDKYRATILPMGRVVTLGTEADPNIHNNADVPLQGTYAYRDFDTLEVLDDLDPHTYFNLPSVPDGFIPQPGHMPYDFTFERIIGYASGTSGGLYGTVYHYWSAHYGSDVDPWVFSSKEVVVCGAETFVLVETPQDSDAGTSAITHYARVSTYGALNRFMFSRITWLGDEEERFCEYLLRTEDTDGLYQKEFPLVEGSNTTHTIPGIAGEYGTGKMLLVEVPLEDLEIEL